ncbi:MAG TPA: hypothetical protein VEJ38_11975 [Candidatus Acidoferrales bacterium]|nr:hypothetical protein [Candidatus Acidoferrales bacterium]
MTRRRQDGERGGSKLNTLITLVVLGAMIFAGVKIVPVYFANYQLQDAMQTEARFALSSFPKKGPDDLRDDIYKKVQELDVPAKKEAIKATMDPASGSVDLSLDYSVTIDLKLYQWVKLFHLHADNHSI